MPHEHLFHAAFALFVFCSGAVPLYGNHSQKNEIQLDFSQSPQRVELHFFLNEHLFLHAEAERICLSALFLFVQFGFVVLLILYTAAKEILQRRLRCWSRSQPLLLLLIQARRFQRRSIHPPQQKDPDRFRCHQKQQSCRSRAPFSV